MTHFEESLQRDIERIRAKVTAMAALCERALRDSLKALQESNRQLAFAVIIRDQRIDEMEKEIDRLCLEFLVRQQPVAGPLRFAYATIRINLELERVGDYAESIAREILKLIAMKFVPPLERFVEIATLAIPMLRDAVRAFIDQNADLAKSTMELEILVDGLRNQINAELFQLREQNKIPFESLTPLMTIARRFERVADQAKNICEETLYLVTGEYSKHKGEEVFRVLFVDEHNSSASLMAEAIGNALDQPKFVFASAGIKPELASSATLKFMQEKGFDLARHIPRTLDQVPNIEHYQIIIGLDREAQKALPPPRKTVYLDWSVHDPSKVDGSPAQSRVAYEQTYQFLHGQIQDLVEAVLGDKRT